MQKINIHLRVNDAKAILVDEYNQTLSTSNIPAITRGVKCDLVLVLLGSDGEPIPADQVKNLVAWDFVLADDWITSTTPQIRVCEGISVEASTITIPLSDTNTVELISYLGNNATKTLGAELAGFEPGETHPAFLIQFDLAVRNRRSDAGTGKPTEVPDGNLNAAQTYALLRSQPDFQFSVDGSEWHETQDVLTDRYFRFRYLEGAWSEKIELLQGRTGDTGQQGIQGIQGIQGVQGIQGIQGEKGNTGDPAPYTQIQYSINGTSWHDEVRTDTDIYERVSTDGGITWSAARMFRGARGFQGLQGIPGPAGAGFDDFPAGSATYMLYVSNQSATAFEMGEDGEKLVARNGFPTWERDMTSTNLIKAVTLNFNSFSSYQQTNDDLGSGGFSGGAVNQPEISVATVDPVATDYTSTTFTTDEAE